MTIDPGLRQLALGTLLAGFAGPSMPPWARDLLADGLAGFTLFATNVTDRLPALTADLRAARPDVILAIDEEGGDVTRLAHRTGSPYPGNAALGAVDDPDLTRGVYAAIGADLSAVGITLNLAPVVDVNTETDNPVIGTRSFGAHPAQVARHTAAAIDGLQSAAVAACAKHFPGHGATRTDSHLGLPTVDVPLAVLQDRDLPPFAAAVSAGVQAIMTAHIRVPALTGTAPATFSRAALHDLLRGEYGFTGTVVTDALEMAGACAAAGGIGAAAVLALDAGADLLCLGARVDAGLVDLVVAEIADAVTEGRLDRRRLEDAAGRTAALAAWAPHADPAATAADSSASALSAGGSSAVGLSAGRLSTVGAEAARRAVRVEGVVTGLAGPLVIRVGSAHSIAEGRLPWGLAPHLAGVEEIPVVAAEVSAAEIAGWAGARPVVVVGRHLHRAEATRGLVEALAARCAVVVVELGWPSSWRPAGAQAFVVTFGASLANGRAAAEVLECGPALP
ncbi:glycoside hydrolase family 3 protein [Actinoplanes sp. NPDC051859]|uniref:glycoside hydrolase family 3 protein n=1 Tax=Actinoplanes sp. NPDC051859 TaxID=3363909 RepID=UPI0037994E00